MKQIIQHYYVPDETATKAQKWLCNALNRRGLTQDEFAKKIHTTRATVSKLVNGHTKIRFDTVCAICWVCKIGDDPDEIWNYINS